MKQAILFDLDGTLLPMDQEEFTNGYFKLLAAKMAPHGYEPKSLVDALWMGVGAMVKNDGGPVLDGVQSKAGEGLPGGRAYF